MKSERSMEKEWMDLGHYSPEEYRDCLYQLDRVGRLLGGDKATFWAIDTFCPSPKSILDVGCGGGLFTKKLKKRYVSAEVVGIDIAKEAIDYATEKSEGVKFHQCEAKDLLETFDVVTTTLVCHHMTDEELVMFFQQAKERGNCVIINDLHRHFLASVGFGTLAPVLFRNRMITHDGLLSIKRSFKRADWERLLDRAEISNYELIWKWPFRWIVVIK